MLYVLQDLGNNVDSRLGKTKEVSSVINLTKPLNMVAFPYGRRFNYFGMLMESLWPLTQINDAELLSNWNSMLPTFADDGKSLYGAYGPRLNFYNMNNGEDNLTTVISMLNDDHTNRQAVLPIIHPDDVGMQTKDFPCNLLVMFKVRPSIEGDLLHMTVVNRSNDIHWGLMAVNFPQFAMLQNYVAHSIGVKVGEQTHVSDSLHLYLESEPHKIITSRMIKANDELYSDFNFKSNKDRTPFEIFPEDGHTENYIERMLIAIASGEEFDCSGLSTFLRAAGGILSTYPLVKKNRLSALNQLRPNVIDWLNKNRDRDNDIEDIDSFPVEWLFGAYATIVHGAPETKKSNLAYQAVGEFESVLNAVDPDLRDKYIDDDTYYRMLEFFKEG